MPPVQSPERLQRLSTLLDEALDLDGPARERWLAALPAADAELSDTLRQLLARHATKETADLLSRGPAFDLPDGGPRAGDVVGPYRLVSTLGVGGMGAVWLAERADGSLKRKVALKLPLLSWAPGLSERFARERDILATLEHPHIARLYDAGLDAQGRPYMALEVVEGRPIDAFCREQALPVAACLQLLLQVADALAYAHGRLVLHRDLKPANILVTAQGQVRLLDFGVAKLMQGDSAVETALTRVSGRAMTPDYASPEQVRGEPLGTASDVYSLGVVAYELLAGTRPYRLQRGSAAELEEAITAQEIMAASSAATAPATREALRGNLDAILHKALQKAVSARYPTVDALAQDWRRHLEGARVLARPDSLAQRLSRVVRRQRAPLAAALLATAAFVLALGFGATALVVAALLAGLGAALWQARKAQLQARLAQQEGRTARAVQTFVLDLFEATSAIQKDPLKAQQTTARELLEIGAQRIAHTLADAPESRISVLHTLGEMHWMLGLRSEAARLKMDALAAARAAFGERDLRFARAAVDAVRSIEDTPRRHEIPALLEAADAAFAAAGDAGLRERPAVLMMLSRHHRHESLPDAVRTGEAAVLALARVDAGSPELINAYRAAGRARIQAGDLDLAEAHVRAAVNLSDRQGEGRATWLVNARAELAEVLFKQGRFDAADVEARAAVDLSLQAHGPSHRWTLIVRIRLSNQLMKTGAVSDGLAHRAAVEQELARDRPEYDPQFRADMASYLASGLSERGRPDRAEALVRADLADLQQWFPNSSAVAAGQADLALVLAALGRLDEARALAEAALALWQRFARGLAATARNAQFLTALSTVHRLAGRPDQAWALLDAWPAPTHAARGRWLDVVVHCTIERMEVALALGRFDQVRAASDSELAALRTLAGRRHLPHLEGQLRQLRGQAALAAGDTAAASADFDEAIATRRPHDDDASLWLADLWVLRAECARRAVQPGVAEQALAEADRIHACHGEVAAYRSLRLAQLRSQQPPA